MLNFSADCRPRWRIKWVMKGGSLRPLESLCGWLPTKLGWSSGFWVTADCLFFGWLPKQLIADHWLWILWFRLNAEIGKGGVDLLGVLGSTEEGVMAAWNPPRCFSSEKETTDRAFGKLIGWGVIAELTQQSTAMHLPFGQWWKKLRNQWQCNRIVMAANRCRRAKKEQWVWGGEIGGNFKFPSSHTINSLTTMGAYMRPTF